MKTTDVEELKSLDLDGVIVLSHANTTNEDALLTRQIHDGNGLVISIKQLFSCSWTNFLDPGLHRFLPGLSSNFLANISNTICRYLKKCKFEIPLWPD